jgi:hypothetical protein
MDCLTLYYLGTGTISWSLAPGPSHGPWHRDHSMVLGTGTIPWSLAPGPSHGPWHRDHPMVLCTGTISWSWSFASSVQLPHALYKGYISRDKSIVNHRKVLSWVTSIVDRTLVPCFPYLSATKLCRNWCSINWWIPWPLVSVALALSCSS